MAQDSSKTHGIVIIDCNNSTTSKAAKIWGMLGQLAILQEECAECISAISRFNRGRTDTTPIAEEIADVIVCMQSVIKVLNVEDKVKFYMEKKIDRLNNRICVFDLGEEL